ncbi:uncharacterized transmembrane protein DDB_G0289901-like isoform X33 [Leopardus geoffroyi]|uniref:uncharacterized transmembrane protein DDB_G0289901-like isoform X33 n=1 Tax=Leopardus geoffroyi TaxID=46844 RepID=UPI001E2648F9|nr:uncharacterized transmembrane protein DDB_G0289901-like isoform X33 [Leopardus geoffroyi]
MENRWECGEEVAVIRKQVGAWRTGGSGQRTGGSVEDRWQWLENRWEHGGQVAVVREQVGAWRTGGSGQNSGSMENRWECGGQVAVVREQVAVVREQVGVWRTGGSGQRTGGSVENKWEWSENSGSVEDRWEWSENRWQCGQVGVIREQVGAWRTGDSGWRTGGSGQSRWEGQQPHRGDWQLPLGQSPVPSRLSAPRSTLAARRTWQGSCVPKCQFSGLTLEISVFVP